MLVLVGGRGRAIMTADRRFPWLHPIDGRSIPHVSRHDQGALRSWSRRITGRTNCQPWFNELSGGVHFCLGGPSLGVTVERVLLHDGSLRLPEEDDAVRRIHQGRVPARLKDRMMRDGERRCKHDRIEAMRLDQQDRRSDRIDFSKHNRNKLEMGRHSRPSISVPK